MNQKSQKQGFAKYPQLGMALMELMDVLVTIHTANPAETETEAELMDAISAAIEDYEKKTLPASNEEQSA